MPQAVKVLPPRHTPLSQQPLQFAQSGALPPAAFPPAALPPAVALPPPAEPPTHTPAVHAWVGMQVAQVRPSLPQAKPWVPIWHSSLASQQPAQFERRHFFVVMPHEGDTAATTPMARPTRNARPFMAALASTPGEPACSGAGLGFSALRQRVQLALRFIDVGLVFEHEVQRLGEQVG